MNKIYIMPTAKVINLQGESNLMVASVDGENLINVSLDQEGEGGDSQMTRQQSLWDNWSE